MAKDLPRLLPSRKRNAFGPDLSAVTIFQSLEIGVQRASFHNGIVSLLVEGVFKSDIVLRGTILGFLPQS
jgi:hypothetical protein